MGKTFYISDLHFGHTNILSFDNRPFKDIQTHDREIVSNWNGAVGIDDEVWILGDVSFSNNTSTLSILKQLNGIKHLCIGNHDGKLLKNKDIRNQFAEIVHYKEIERDDGIGIVLCHYPISCFKNHYYGWYHLYGHVHSSFEYHIVERIKYEMQELYGKDCKMYNVGCMIPYMNYTPKTLEEIVDGADSKR